jgi:crotonobetainyl-CoA:carnitine CoA-transferase CaiB-like acyl-CoA transferase
MSALVSQAKTSAPLVGLRVSVAGQSRCELLLAKILRDQGADVLFAGGPTGPSPDVIIDAERGEPGNSTEVSNDDGAISCVFTGMPYGAPFALPVTSESLIAAELGLHRCASAQARPEAEPLAMASGYAAIWAAIYITAALRIRRATGRVCHIRVPLFSAAMSVMGRRLISVERPDLFDPRSVPRLPLADIYECRDGRFVQNHGTFGHFAEILCRVIGHEEWSADAVAAMKSLRSAAEVEEWRARFAAAFLQRDALEWERVLNEAGGACTMCRTHAEWRADDGAITAGIVAADREPADRAAVGMTGPTGPALKLSAESLPAENGQAVAAPGTAWPTGPQDEGSAGPLSGLRVLDFCIVLAGPTCGRTLAELGADVIKIDAPDREVNTYGWLDVNRGKRSMLVDLRSPDGMRIVRQLIADADVVLENFRSGKLEALGLGYDAVREIQPDIVYASMNAFDHGGTWSRRAGWEHNAQAASGMQTGRQRDGRPRAVPVPVNDYATGLLAALGVLLAIVRRDMTGAPARVRASLARTATYLLLGESDGDSAQSAVRDSALSFRTKDGWIRVAADDVPPAADLPPWAGIADQSSADAVAALRQMGVLAAVERAPQDLLGEDWVWTEGLLAAWEHPRWGAMRQAVARPTASEFEISPRWPAPDPGEHTEEIMRQLGYNAAEISHLKAAGAITSRLPLFPAHDGSPADHEGDIDAG